MRKTGIMMLMIFTSSYSLLSTTPVPRMLRSVIFSLLIADEDQETVEEVELRAVRDISKGEEITIFYLQKLASISLHQMRQNYLKNQFGFDCKCSVCCGDVDDQDSRTASQRRSRKSYNLQTVKCFSTGAHCAHPKNMI